MRNNGFKNEYDFVKYFNNKYLKDFDLNSKEFLIDLFDGNIDNSERIICYKNKLPQKTDIFIKFKNYTKGVSLKCGKNNSVDQETIDEFKKYLADIGIPYKVIEYYVSFHFGYKRNNDGTRDLNTRLSSEEYRKIYQDELDVFNKYINKSKIIIGMVDRFVIRGRNSNYDIDALISGTPENYVWINKYDLYDLFLSKKNINFDTPHISCLIIGPKSRGLTELKKSWERYSVCIKWLNPGEDIKKFKKIVKNNRTY